MKPMNFESRWILVTGASSGLGREMSVSLAKNHRANLVLVARRADKLEELAHALTSKFGISVRTISADLSREDDAVRVFTEATKEKHLYGAILNAGVTHFGHHDEMTWDQFRNMLSLNVLTTTRLCTLALPYLESRREQGGILLVSSMAGLTPVPYQTAYSATKAFLVSYGAGLHHEMWPRGVSVTTFAPGGIITEMTAGERFDALRSWLMPVDRCAESALKSFQKREYIAVPGFTYQVGSVLARVLPQRFFVGQVAARYRKSLAQVNSDSSGASLSSRVSS